MLAARQAQFTHPYRKDTIKSGDEVLSINEHQASGSGLHSLRLMLQTKDRPVRIHLRRGEATFQATLFGPATAHGPEKGPATEKGRSPKGAKTQ